MISRASNKVKVVPKTPEEIVQECYEHMIPMPKNTKKKFGITLLRKGDITLVLESIHKRDMYEYEYRYYIKKNGSIIPGYQTPQNKLSVALKSFERLVSFAS